MTPAEFLRTLDQQATPGKVRFIRVIPARFGGVGHIVDSQDGKMLCGGTFEAYEDFGIAPKDGDCKRCLKKYDRLTAVVADAEGKK